MAESPSTTTRGRPRPSEPPGLAPVFLVGCPRSGTTLLQRLLDAHPQVAIAPETHFVRRFWMRRDTYGDLSSDQGWTRLVDDVVAIDEFREMGLDPDAFRAAAQSVDRSCPALFELLLRLFAQQRGVAIVGEKTPNHLLYMPLLKDFFPRARFVHIIRDPRAVVNSWRTVPWSTGTIAGDTGVWKRYIRTAAKQRPGKSDLKLVRHETLVARPETELRGLCEFLHLPFDPAMLAFHEREPVTLNFRREPWKARAGQAIDSETNERWREQLSPAQVEEIEQLAWREMYRFGYKPATKLTTLLAATGRRVGRAFLRRARTRLTGQSIAAW